MANGLKYSITTETETLRKGNFWLAVGDVQKPFGTYYTAIVPPSGGYSIYQNKPSDGPAIYVANSDAELIQYTKLIMGTTFATGPSALNWYNSQTDKMVTNIEYPQIVTNGLLLNLDAGFTPSYPRGGTSWYDTGPTGFTAYLINGPSFGASGYGNIILDGTNDLITCDLSGNTSNSYTFSMMLNTIGMTAGTLDRRSIFGVLNSSQSSPRTFRQFNMEFWGNTVRSYRGNGGTGGENVDFFQYITGAFVTPNSLNQIAVTVYSTGSQYYINGVLAGTLSTPSNLVAPFTTIVIGSRATTPVNVWAGNVYQFSAYNRNLSSTEIFQNYQAMLPRLLGENIVTNGMVYYLDAGFPNSYGGTGTTWTNVAGTSGGNGTLTNGPTFNSSNGGSIVFDGTNDYVNCGDIFNDVMAGAGKQFTYNCTFVPAGTGLINQFLFGKYADGGFTAENGREFAVAVRNDGSGLKIRVVFSTNLSGSANAVESDTTLVVNNTYNISITYDDTQSTSLGKVNIYINGIISSKTLTVNGAFGPIAAGPAKFGLGAGISSTNQTGYHFNGRIFNLSLYSKLLTSVEITQNYNAQKSRFGL